MNIQQAIARLREYASAWRALGCSCYECPQSDARAMTPEEADSIADVMEGSTFCKACAHAFDAYLQNCPICEHPNA